MLGIPANTSPVQSALNQTSDTDIKEGNSILDLPETNKFTSTISTITSPSSSIPIEPKGGGSTVISKEDISVAEQHQAEHTHIYNETDIFDPKGSVGMELNYQDFLDFINTKMQSGTKMRQEELDPYLNAASEGSPEYQFHIGVTLCSKEVFEKDYANAMHWFHKAGEQGHAEAQFNLGVMYWDGQGVTQDYSKALEWHLKAANQGYASA
ncbi:hypothetical protein BGZ76_004340, partial [Entomortierella beljakovae]